MAQINVFAKKQKEIQAYRISMWTPRGERRVGWDELKDWDWHIYITMYKIDNENLLKNTRNSTDCSVVTEMWRESKKRVDIGIYITDSFFCTAETNTGIPRWHSGKNPPINAGDLGLIPGLGRSPGGQNGNPLHFSCLENLVDRGAWQATFHGVAKSQTQLSNWAHTHKKLTQDWKQLYSNRNF